MFEDDRLMLPPNHVPYCMEDLTDFCVRICVPDPDDSTKIPMYNKKEVKNYFITKVIYKVICDTN